MSIKTKEEFDSFADAFWSDKEKPYAFGIGLNYIDSSGDAIATKFLTVNVESNYGTLAALAGGVGVGGRYTLFPVHVKRILADYFAPFMSDGEVHANIDAISAIKKLSHNGGKEGTSIYGTKFICQDNSGNLKKGTSLWGVVYVCQDRDDLLSGDISCVEDAHFRLALMSRLHFKPNEQCLNGIFSALPNVIYTNKGCHSISDWNRNWFMFQAEGEQVLCQDKFPPYFWANPAVEGVRIANADMVRHGAHIVPDTTLMHYGSANFNSGTLGKAMVEGRIPHGVTVGAGSDLGAGCGFLGTLSGGNSVILSAGKDSLIGANAECGVQLGDNCKVTTGTCFGQSTPFMEMIPTYHREGGEITGWEELGWKKAEEFNGVPNLTFRQNAKTGRMEVLHIGNKVELNEELHKNE